MKTKTCGGDMKTHKVLTLEQHSKLTKAITSHKGLKKLIEKAMAKSLKDKTKESKNKL